MRIFLLSVALLVAPGATLCVPVSSGQTTAPPGDIADLSLEQLSDIVITSLSRQESRLASAPAALYIVSADDIRRSGARSLPEALRLAPNLQVARSNARDYAISARGFNSVFANKLLVLIDGRSVYSPLFSGVFWDTTDVLMADIARIEVISGPGATIWGANAVNGVINIITKSSADTQGGLASASAGAGEYGTSVRYGGTLSGGATYRLYAKTGEDDDSINQAGRPIPSGWRRAQTGFRIDQSRTDADLTVSADAYRGQLAQGTTPDITIGGANLIGRYTIRQDADATLRLQLIAEYSQREQPNIFTERLSTLDLEAQHDQRRGAHYLAWGGGYRVARDRIVNGVLYAFLPATQNLHSANAFAQDEITVAPTVRATVGLKLEHNHYTGLEVLPNARLAWRPDSNHLIWTSLSRTVRAPSRIDRDLYSPAKPVLVSGVLRYRVAGGPQFDSETAKVLEIGYRAQSTSHLSWSATAFYSDYQRLRTLEPRPGASSQFANLGAARAHGLELWSRWQVLPTWRLDGSAVFQRLHNRLLPESLDSAASSALATNDPERRYTLRSSHDLSEHTQLNVSWRYMGVLPRPLVPSYQELDVNVIWKPLPNLDVSVTGQNLLHRRHAEFGPVLGRSVFERSVLLNLAYRF